MSDEDWLRLQKIASSLATETTAPTAGQVASQLLHDAIEGFAPEKPAEPRVSRISEPERPPYVRARAADDRTRQANIDCAAREFAAVVLENTAPSADRSTALHLIRAASVLACAALGYKGRSS